MFKKIVLYIHTLRFLKIRQVWFQLVYKLNLIPGRDIRRVDHISLRKDLPQIVSVFFMNLELLMVERFPI